MELRIPFDLRQNSWLFTSVADELKSAGRLRNKSSERQGGGVKLGISGSYFQLISDSEMLSTKRPRAKATADERKQNNTRVDVQLLALISDLFGNLRNQHIPVVILFIQDTKQTRISF